MKSHTDIQPWYRQFWPWFLIVLPGSVVVAGIATVLIAFQHSDSVVSDNYYKEGLAINRVVAQDRRAQALDLAAELRLAGEVVELTLGGELSPPSALHLSFKHPLQAAQDFSLPLSRSGENRYEGSLPAAIDGRWYLELGDIAGEWRLQGELQLSHSSRARLQAGVNSGG